MLESFGERSGQMAWQHVPNGFLSFQISVVNEDVVVHLTGCFLVSHLGHLLEPFVVEPFTFSVPWGLLQFRFPF